MERCYHELTIVADDRRMAGMDGLRFGPSHATAEAILIQPMIGKVR
jgi:hypothetical protein